MKKLESIFLLSFIFIIMYFNPRKSDKCIISNNLLYEKYHTDSLYRKDNGFMLFDVEDYKATEDCTFVKISRNLSKNITHKVSYAYNSVYFKNNCAFEKFIIEKDTTLNIQYNIGEKEKITFYLFTYSSMVNRWRDKHDGKELGVLEVLKLLDKKKLINTNDKLFYGYNKDSLYNIIKQQ